MGKKWMPVTAGVLDIIHGIGGIFLGFLFVALSISFGRDIIVNETTGSILMFCGTLAIIGGIFVIRRAVWPMALIGAILSLAPSVPYMYSFWLSDFNPDNFFDIFTLLGFSGIPAVVAIILTVLAKKQFVRK
jgi:hypothetical protein